MLVMLPRLRVHDPSNVQCTLSVHAALSASLNQLHACFSSCSSSPSSTAAGADQNSSSAEDAACQSGSSLAHHHISKSLFSSSNSSSSLWNDTSELSPIDRQQQQVSGGHTWHRLGQPQQQQPYHCQHHGLQKALQQNQQQQQQQQPSAQRRHAWQCAPATGPYSWAQQQLWQQHPQGQPHKQHLQWLQQLRHSSSTAGRDNLWQEYSSAAAAAAQQQQQPANKQLPPDVNFIPLSGRMAPVRRSPQRRGAAAAAAAAGRVAPEPAWAVLEQARQDQRHSRSGMQYNRVEPQEKLYPVDALHLGAAIDVANFANEYKSDFADVISNPPHRDHSIFLLKISSDDQDMLNPGSSEPVPRYMIVYRYGSVIFMNVPEDERKRQLALLKPFIIHQQGQEAAAAADENTSTLRTDKTTIVVRPHLEEWSDLEDDQIVVQQLDLSGMRVISHVLSQSVALDYFNWRVDNAIQQFTPYLTAVAQTGACDTVKEARLLQLIADNSLLYTDVVTKIGLLDMNPTAWKNDKHYKLWEDLRLDYEIERRFDAINRKLGPMLENAKFLLDVRAEQKSSGAEWIIIGLICLEVLMNGFGHLAAYLW